MLNKMFIKSKLMIQLLSYVLCLQSCVELKKSYEHMDTYNVIENLQRMFEGNANQLDNDKTL